LQEMGFYDGAGVERTSVTRLDGEPIVEAAP
jgi:hypothetical protein